MTYLAHQSPRFPNTDETDFKLESMGKLLNSFDGEAAFAVHERAERRGMDASRFGNRNVRPFVFSDRVSKFLKQGHEFHDNWILAA